MSKMRKPKDLVIKCDCGDELKIEAGSADSCHFRRNNDVSVFIRNTDNISRIIRKLTEIKKWMESK